MSWWQCLNSWLKLFYTELIGVVIEQEPKLWSLKLEKLKSEHEIKCINSWSIWKMGRMTALTHVPWGTNAMLEWHWGDEPLDEVCSELAEKCLKGDFRVIVEEQPWTGREGEAKSEAEDCRWNYPKTAGNKWSHEKWGQRKGHLEDNKVTSEKKKKHLTTVTELSGSQSHQQALVTLSNLPKQCLWDCGHPRLNRVPRPALCLQVWVQASLTSTRLWPGSFGRVVWGETWYLDSEVWQG